MMCRTKKYACLFAVVYLLIVPCLLRGNIHAQPKQSVQALRIGDRVPEVVIHKLINYPDQQLRLSDLHGKLTIIDFWGTTCVSCISALPKFQEVQEHFPDKVKVLTVTRFDEVGKVRKTFDRFKILKNFSLPVILDGEQLANLFPHEIVSHVVWIDGNGIVRAITGTDYVTTANVSAVLQGQLIQWPVKVDVMGFDYDKSLLKLNLESIGGPAPAVYFSSFTGNLAGIDGTDRISTDSVQQVMIRNHINHTLLQLCDGALNGTGTGSIPRKRLILEVPDTSRYIKGQQYASVWMSENTFTYSVTLPLYLSKEQVTTFIREDLTRWLKIRGIKVKKELRKTSCLVLRRVRMDDALLRSKGGPYRYELKDTSKIKTLQNAGFSNFLWALNKETPNIPWVVDETGIVPDMKVDMRLQVSSLQDIANLQKGLLQYGLELVPAERMLEMYVIKESNQP